MADAVEIDLYADDLEQEFGQDEFVGDGIDLYDDVITDPSSGSKSNPESTVPSNSTSRSETTAISNHNSVQYSSTHTGRRYQLYVGNLTWWTTDQDITDAIVSLGIQDFIEVKFFENRSNGRSKGFCLVSLGSEQSMRLCMERLPKKELHGQTPAVTYTTKQALNKFEAQTESRPSAPPNNQASQRIQHPGVPMAGNPRAVRMPPQIRNRTPPPGMQPVPPRMPPGPHMGGPIPPHGGPNQQHPFQNSWQNGMRQNGPPRPPGPPQPMSQQRPGAPPPPGMFQGPPPPGQGPPPRGPPPGIPGGPPDQRGPPPRPDWNRPPGMQGPGFMGPHQQMPGMQHPPAPGQGPPNRGPPPPNMGGGPVPQGGNSHVNPSFFGQGGGPPMQQPHSGPPQVPPQGPPQGPPQNPHGPPIPNPLDYGPPAQARMHPFVGGGMMPQEHRSEAPSLSETEFEEIMSRNRTVSSSAIARAVSDAAAGEYASAIETLVTAISLIKQSKAANDDRCKILISSLQDTLRGVEAKSYGAVNRRERSRSRERERPHRRSRRERTRSRERDYRDRSRERERDRERERERDKERYYPDNYGRERSRSRDREREREYRERSREDRYYDDRYRERERERDRDRERERETTRREPERERERDRERERERERAESSHRSSRH